MVQDIFLTETAALADVVLPAACYAEKDGTFTNTERRVQRVRKAVEPPGEARADWEIICALAERAGYAGMRYPGPAAVMDEIAGLTPIYGGIGYDRLDPHGLQWPCPDRDHPGTPVLHVDRFTRGLGRFSPVAYRPPAELPDADYPFVLTTGRTYFHWHTGTMTRRTHLLDREERHGLRRTPSRRCRPPRRARPRRGAGGEPPRRGAGPGAGHGDGHPRRGVHAVPFRRRGGQRPHQQRARSRVGHSGVQGLRGPGAEGAMKVLTPDRLADFFARLAATYEVRLPVLLPDGTRTLGHPGDGPIALHGGALPGKPTAAFFPQHGPVFTAADGSVLEPPAPARPLFVAGFTPRDLACLRFIDRFFADGWRDDLYFRQRQGAVVAGVSGYCGPGAHCCRRPEGTATWNWSGTARSGWSCPTARPVTGHCCRVARHRPGGGAGTVSGRQRRRCPTRMRP